jgi:uncharacterized membrane protein YoaK (UPF0700 family)
MKIERFNYLYFFLGVFFGFLIGSSVDPETSVVVKKYIFAIAIICIAFFWRRLESNAQRHNLATREHIQQQGKWYFIITRYLLLRGIILSAILIGPVISTLLLSTVILKILTVSLVPLIGLMFYYGVEEWNDCEQEVQIIKLKQVSEVISTTNN